MSLADLAHQPGSHLILFPDIPAGVVRMSLHTGEPPFTRQALQAEITGLRQQLAERDIIIETLLAAQADHDHAATTR